MTLTTPSLIIGYGYKNPLTSSVSTMINTKSTKLVILAAYQAADHELTETRKLLRIALIWAISSTVLLLAF